MAWNDSAITVKGNIMMNQLLSGQTLLITGAIGGRGTVNPEVLCDLTNVIDPVQNLGLAEIETRDDCKIFKIQVLNTNLDEGYQLQQIAVMARLESGSEETALFVLQDEKGIHVPSKSETGDFVFEIYVPLCLSTQAEIKLSVNRKALVTRDDFEREISQIKNTLARPIVAHTMPAKSIFVRWFADGYAEAWVRYRVPNVTTPHERGSLYLSNRFTLPFPDVYTSTADQEMPIVCEANLVGAESADNTEPLLLFSSGSDDGYVSNMRFYIGAMRQLTEETPVHIRMHLVWHYKPDENGNVEIPTGGGGGFTVTDDGAGNVTITSSGGLSITDDGNGNVTITSYGGVSIADDGNGNVTIE